MLNTLRNRLILSHIIPVAIILPIMGFVLAYVITTQVMLVSISRGLQYQARIVAELTLDHVLIWDNHNQAHIFASRIERNTDAKIMILDTNGELMASNDPHTRYHSQPPTIANLAQVLRGEPITQINNGTYPQDDVAEVLVPVIGNDHRIHGIIRLTYPNETIQEDLARLKLLIILVVTCSLFVSIGIGWVLAINLERPLARITHSIHDLARGRSRLPLSAKGPYEIMLLAQAFNTLVARLDDLEQSQRKLLSNLVHELGQQLGALRSALQALLGGADEDPALRRELIAGMDSGAQRLQRLLDDLARLYDRTAGTLELDPQPIPLGVWLMEVLPPWREQAQAQGLSWQADIPSQLPVVTFDPDRLAQALGNLLNNAIKYTPSGGEVFVRAGNSDDMQRVWIRVSDTGPGISSTDQERIFTPFYRCHTVRRFPEGMGLGLAIARDLVVAHRGTLEIQSTPGQGSHFTIWLPLADS